MKRPNSPLTHTEAEWVAEDLARGWQGMTGLTTTPGPLQLADLVQRVLRRAAEVVAERAD